MKKIHHTDHRIIVYPNMLYRDATDEQRICTQIMDEIQRHVDNIGSIEIVSEKEEKCSYCGYGWDEDINGEPMCCGKAQADWAKENHEHFFATDVKLEGVQKSCTICGVVL